MLKGRRLQGFGFRVKVSYIDLRVQHFWSRLYNSGLRLAIRVQGSGFKVQGSGFKVQGSGFRVQAFGLWVSVSGSGLGVRGSSSGWGVESRDFFSQNLFIH